MDFPRIEAVEPVRGKQLRVTFVNGSIKLYDCKPLLAEEPFRNLEGDVFFRSVAVEHPGHAVVWSDEVDLAGSELWIHGDPV